MAEKVEILVEPFQQQPALSQDRLRDLVLDHPGVQRLLCAADPHDVQVSAPEIIGRTLQDDSPFEATAFDPIGNRAVLITGRLDEPEKLTAQSTAFRPNPTTEELGRAAAVLRADEGFAELAGRDDVVIYQPMPPLADLEQPDGTRVRRPTLGILDPTGERRHRLVAVDLAAKTVDWAPAGIEHPNDGDCESRLPLPAGSLPDSGGPDQVRVRVRVDGEELWNLIVVRPRASTPAKPKKGSGVELRHVTYRRRLVFWQAHVPILNVLYDDNVTFRDWQNEETQFQATGSDPVGPGWRLCTSPPATILEAGTDEGNFQGVALWYDNGELRIVSEVQAGWYRYVSDWRLRNDGTIMPRFGFAGTRNPRTCMRHQHHVYWRFDFDIEGAANDVVQQRNLFPLALWQSIVQEVSRKRSFFARGWRVIDKVSHRGYSITPGVTDSTADAFGVADLWFLRYHGTELEDGVQVVGGTPADTSVKLDQFLNGEAIDGTDVVIWYAGHFIHNEEHPEPHQGHIVGPELRPINWQ